MNLKTLLRMKVKETPKKTPAQAGEESKLGIKQYKLPKEEEKPKPREAITQEGIHQRTAKFLKEAGSRITTQQKHGRGKQTEKNKESLPNEFSTRFQTQIGMLVNNN